ncbi:MAG: hypothetical protein P8I03_02770 [Thalassotalea sp.]|nr:hypothetical protein [Thalassotalea sp.]
MSSNRYEVYLNRKAMGKSLKRIYSIRSAQSGLVRWSNPDVLLKDVELVVQPSGRNDTLNRLATNAKVSRTVHAFLRGNVVNRGRNASAKANQLGITQAKAKAVSYDPVKTKHWVNTDSYRMPEDNIEQLPIITTAKYAYLHKDGILVLQ